MAREIGIIAIQNTVSQPLTLRMKTGSPWIDAHRLLITTPSVPSKTLGSL